MSALSRAPDRGGVRILYAASNIICPGTNGGSTHVTEVVTRFRRRGDELLLIAHAASTLDHTLAVGRRTPPVGLRHVNMLRLFRRVRKAVRSFGPEIVYERGSSFGLGALLARENGVPLVLLIGDRQVSRLALARASRIVATTLVVVPPRYHHKTTLFHLGAATDLFSPDSSGAEVRARLSIDPSELVIGYAGGFYHWHGLEELVDAISLLRPSAPRVLMVGHGGGAAGIRSLVQRFGLQEQFIFTGAVPYPDVPSYLAAMDICVAPYNPARLTPPPPPRVFRYEPLKVFEYMAMGKPVVTSDTENLSRLFTNGEQALLATCGSAPALASALQRLLADPDLRLRMGEAARTLVEQRYSWNAHVDHLRSVMDEVRAGSRASNPGSTPCSGVA
jgi:glycosyltransferase involved in cell wall biosynthesis